MNGFFDRVLGQLEAGLLSMEKEKDLSRRYAGCGKLAKKSIAELKGELRAQPFTTKAEEIIYFRDQAPVIYSRLFYFTTLRVFLSEPGFVG